ncbi:hypothetical protein GDO81_021256 [Engystomops pustulosus]|uniref:Secreted protein n=1 Tax=Engystomops pustulosus TaxID=76066 RepID=A0AAV6ZJ13_ENGPU|nr:hypothetical protein GDO81_021256 [Engystomops pustulosus]
MNMSYSYPAVIYSVLMVFVMYLSCRELVNCLPWPGPLRTNCPVRPQPQRLLLLEAIGSSAGADCWSVGAALVSTRASVLWLLW